MTVGRKAIVCDGQPVTDAGAPAGEACGNRFRGRGPEPVTEQARAAGWALSPEGHAICPGCRKPSRAAVDITTYQSQSTEE